MLCAVVSGRTHIETTDVPELGHATGTPTAASGPPPRKSICSPRLPEYATSRTPHWYSEPPIHPSNHPAGFPLMAVLSKSSSTAAQATNSQLPAAHASPAPHALPHSPQ